jgi:hypothetical protein
MVILVVALSASLAACSPNGNTAYPILPAAATAPIEARGTTPNAASLATSISPGTPAGAAQPGATNIAAPSSGPSSGCDAWRVEKPISLATPFAPNFPIPGGMKWYKTATIRSDSHTQLQITGIVPLNLAESAKFLMSELPKAGYEITNTDSESNEADGLFKGNGWIGSYRVSMLDNCDTSTMWSVRVLKL